MKATLKVADDICASFDIDKDGVFRTTTYRPNLRLEAKAFMSGSEKEADLKDFLNKNPGPSIIYVQTHEQTEMICGTLKKAGFNAHSYHAGMANDVRTKVQDKFMTSSKIVVRDPKSIILDAMMLRSSTQIVATIAFGMGIDKPDIRNIVHYTVPKSLEGYSQEIGRAGRDGLASTCLIYLCVEDIAILEEWSRADVPSLRSVKGLVGELLEIHRYAKPGEVIERNLNDESKEWDIRVSSRTFPTFIINSILTKHTAKRPRPPKRPTRTPLPPHPLHHPQILPIQIHHLPLLPPPPLRRHLIHHPRHPKTQQSRHKIHPHRHRLCRPSRRRPARRYCKTITGMA